LFENKRPSQGNITHNNKISSDQDNPLNTSRTLKLIHPLNQFTRISFLDSEFVRLMNQFVSKIQENTHNLYKIQSIHRMQSNQIRYNYIIGYLYSNN